MPTKPLMTQETFGKFLAIRTAYLATCPPNGVPAYPFVPVCETDSELRPRFLIIGQATRDWDVPGEHDTFENSARTACGALQDLFVNDPGPFWTFVRKFICRTLGLPQVPFVLNELYRNVAWSNIAKIEGPNREPPEGAFLQVQAQLCVQQLNYELNQYKPDVILLLTGTRGHREILIPAFGEFCNRVRKSTHIGFRAVAGSDGCGVPAIWTNHPRNLANGEKGITHDEILGIITKIAAGFL